LSVNTANWKIFSEQIPPKSLCSTFITGVPKRSQWWIKHNRRKDLCSPTSLSIITNYFGNKKRKFSFDGKKFNKKTALFAQRVHDNTLDIYGNWILNVAQAYSSTRGQMFYRVERLNNFEELHSYLVKKIPVAVSIRGALRGGAWPYNNGHFVVVIGWSKRRQRVVCIDPAFRNRRRIVRHYRVKDFVQAWGKSRNLSYVSVSSASFF
jgi:hypothetical protein